MKHTYIFFFIIIVIFCLSCESANPAPDPVYNNCRITKYYSSGDTAQNSTRFYYDNQGRLFQITQPGPGGISWGTQITYETNSVKVSDLQNSDIYSRYYLNSDTLAHSSANYNMGVRTDTVTYFYENRLLTKAVRINHVFGKDSTYLTYSGNNLMLIKSFMSNGAVEQATFTYTSIPSKIWYYRNFAAYVHFDMFYPWFGKGNDHLVSTYSFTYNGNPAPMQHTYDLNPGGYVTRLNMLSMGMSSQGNFEYSCE